MMKKPIPVEPSVAIVSPASNRRSFMVLARPWTSFLSRPENSGTCLMSSSEAAMARILFSDSCAALGPNGLDAAGELFDTALGSVELRRADRVELLTSLPERDRLVEARLAALEPLDDRLQFALCFLERGVAQRVSSTVAPNPPVPSSTSTCVPIATSALERTIIPLVRTIA